MFCKQCGSMLKDSSVFCHRCGVKINVTATINQNIQKREYVNKPIHYHIKNEGFQQTTIGNCSQVSSVGNMASTVMGHAIRRTTSVWRTTGIVTAILAAVVTIFSVYVQFFVSGPEDTLSAFTDAMSNNDIASAIECFCPRMVNEYKGISAISDAIGSLAGFDVNSEGMLGLIPVMIKERNKYTYEIQNVEYLGGNYELFPVKIEGIAKLLASEAVVTADQYLDGNYDGTSTIRLKNYGSDGWLIERDLFSY